MGPQGSAKEAVEFTHTANAEAAVAKKEKKTNKKKLWTEILEMEWLFCHDSSLDNGH